MRNFTGYNTDTKNSLLLNAGAYFKNYDMDKDTYESAMKSGKCLGATQGGGKFDAVPSTRNIEIDGADPEPVIDGWTVTMNANLIEVKPDSLKLALGTGVISNKDEGYYEIRAKRMIDNSDYIGNITWVGTLSGSNEPVIIQIFNTISTSGLSFSTGPKSQAVIPVTFTAKSDPVNRPDDMDFAPFRIFYPKSIAPVVFDKILDSDDVITGKGVTGATVHIAGGTIPANTTGMVENREFAISIPKQDAGTCITGYQKLGAVRSAESSIYVEADLSGGDTEDGGESYSLDGEADDE